MKDRIVNGIPKEIAEGDESQKKDWLAGLTRTWMLLNYIYNTGEKRLQSIEARILRQKAKALEISAPSKREK